MYDGAPTTMTTAAICATREFAWSPSLYRGEQYDSDLGLYYLRARYYNPTTGRFMSRDPENGNGLDPKSLHKYLYANGDPVNGLDPTGRGAYEVGFQLGRAVAMIPALMKVTCVIVVTMDLINLTIEDLGINDKFLPMPKWPLLTCSWFLF